MGAARANAGTRARGAAGAVGAGDGVDGETLGAAVQVVTDADDLRDEPFRGGRATRGPSLRLRIGVGAAIVLVVVALVASVLITALSPVGSTTVFGARDAAVGAPSSTTSAASPPASADAGGEGPRATVLVHLLGAVAHPGVYELAEGARVVDVVGRAGGFAPDADQASVNLARVLTDGEQVQVLAAGEAAAAAVPGGAGAGGGGSSAGTAGAGALVNLNSATELDLDALPRIGPAMAARIVVWRTDNGPFTAVDDLLEVAGIGEKTLEGLRPLVTV